MEQKSASYDLCSKQKKVWRKFTKHDYNPDPVFMYPSVIPSAMDVGGVQVWGDKVQDMTRTLALITLVSVH